MLLASAERWREAGEGVQQYQLPVVLLYPRGPLGKRLEDPPVRCWLAYGSPDRQSRTAALMLSDADLARWAAAMRRQLEDPCTLWLSMLAHLALKGAAGLPLCCDVAAYGSNGFS